MMVSLRPKPPGTQAPYTWAVSRNVPPWAKKVSNRRKAVELSRAVPKDAVPKHSTEGCKSVRGMDWYFMGLHRSRKQEIAGRLPGHNARRAEQPNKVFSCMDDHDGAKTRIHIPFKER